MYVVYHELDFKTPKKIVHNHFEIWKSRSFRKVLRENLAHKQCNLRQMKQRFPLLS